MKKIWFFVLALMISFFLKAQLIQGTIKKGSSADEFEIWLKPNFNNSTQYLFQIGLPIAFPTSASPQPTGINVNLDASFTSTFGANYSVTVNPVANATGGTEKYFNIVLIRGGSGASNPQTWSSGAEFKVLTGTFTYSSGNTTFLAKLADYQDGGSDGQGNFYTLDGNGNYYVTSNSIGNFYASSGNSVVGGTASAGYAQLTSSSLPVSLVNFSGYSKDNKNVLNWTTASEMNNKGFDVERSADGRNFSSIAFVPSKASNGNSSSPLIYSYEDQGGYGVSQYYYRLKQIDMDGRGIYSSTLFIKGESIQQLVIENLYPNPVGEEFSLELYSPLKDRVHLVVIDGNGRTVLTRELMAESGSNSYSVDARPLSRGSYLLQIVSLSKSEKQTMGFIKN